MLTVEQTIQAVKDNKGEITISQVRDMLVAHGFREIKGATVLGFAYGNIEYCTPGDPLTPSFQPKRHTTNGKKGTILTSLGKNLLTASLEAVQGQEKEKPRETRTDLQGGLNTDWTKGLKDPSRPNGRYHK